MATHERDSASWFAGELQPHEPMLRAWLHSRFPSGCDIDDIVQEAYLRVLKAHENGSLQAPKAFLFATARNLALDFLRHRKVERTDALTEIDTQRVMHDDAGIPEALAHTQELELLTQAIQSLPTRCRQILTLRKIYGLPQKEVAAQLGVTEHTVEAQGTIGLRKITEFFDRHERRGKVAAMSLSHNLPDDIDALEQQAAAWVLRRDRGLTASEQDEFSQWLTGDPRRKAWLAKHGRNWDRLDRLADWRREHSPLPNPDLLAPPARRLIRFRTVVPALALAAAAGVTIAVLLHSPRALAPSKPAPTLALAMIEQRVLDDGSVVELNRGAEIEVRFTSGERRVRLEKGEAHFTVAKIPSRPFIVSAGNVDVRAVGTAFNVLLRQEGVEVLVTEGRVQVDEPKPDAVRVSDPEIAAANVTSTEAKPEGKLLLDEGQRATVPLVPVAGHSPQTPQVTRVSTEERDQLLAWQPRLLDFTAAPLSAIVVDFNQRNPVQIVIGEPSLRLLRISASFRSDNIEGFVRLLEASFGVRAERAGLTITLHKAP